MILPEKMMVEMVVWRGTRWESDGDECVYLSEKKRKESKCEEERGLDNPKRVRECVRCGR